ncbi:hypothetical protein D1007_44458 [Hordeum vulgare]|nr:hypothetical protein D1007_44458 [Hordeum vulgare]
MRMRQKHPIGGSGDIGATEAAENGVKMETKVDVAANEVSLDIDVVDGVMLPQKPEVLCDDVNNEDEDGQRRYKRKILRGLYAGIRNKRIRTWNGGFRCPFCNLKLHDAYKSVVSLSRGKAVGSFKQKYSCRVAHAAYAKYLEKLNDRAGRWDVGLNYVWLCSVFNYKCA